MHPAVAREFWTALMDNATSLVVDAQLLLQHESYGRARSLTVLAQEELGKALWVYETFEQAWSDGSAEEQEVPRLASDGRRHAVKYMEAFVFSRELAAFWGDYSGYDHPDRMPEEWGAHFEEERRGAEEAGRRANEEKMAGFYVDLLADTPVVRSPADVPAGTIDEDLQTAARVIEMLLIKDHSRMKLDATTPYDSTHRQQFRLLPISHPDDWAEASDRFKQGEDSPDSVERRDP